MEWSKIKEEAEQWLYTRVRYVIGEISDDPADMDEFLNLDGLYVSGSTVAYSVALARGTVSESKLPGDLDVYAINPLKVAGTNIGKLKLGILGDYGKPQKRPIDLVPLVFNDIREVLNQFDTTMVQCAYDVKRSELVGYTDEYVKLMESESPVFTLTIEKKSDQDRREKCKSRARKWFGGSMVFNKDRLFIGEKDLSQRISGRLPFIDLSTSYPLPWKCMPVVDSFVNYTCITCSENCVMDGTYWSTIGLCGPCYRLLDVVFRSTLAKKRINFQYYSIGLFCDLTYYGLEKDHEENLPTVTSALEYYGLEKDQEENGFIIFTNRGYRDIDDVLRKIAHKYLNSKRLNRMVFIGFPPSGKEKIKLMFTQFAAMNCQVFIYDRPKPTTTLEWGFIFMNLCGIFDTDNLDTVQPAFRRTGRIKSGSPVYPDAERTINFLDMGTRIVGKRRLVQKEELDTILSGPNFWRFKEDLSEHCVWDTNTSRLIRNERDLWLNWQKRPRNLRKELMLQFLYRYQNEGKRSKKRKTRQYRKKPSDLV